MPPASPGPSCGCERCARSFSTLAIPPGRVCNPGLADWFELRAGLAAAEAVAAAALARTESRGAHQRDDFPDTDPAWAKNQRVAIAADGRVAVA